MNIVQDKRIVQLNKLRTTIELDDVSTLASSSSFWGGAEVVINDELTLRLAQMRRERCGVMDNTMRIPVEQPKYTIVITPYARELSWCFFELKGIFYCDIDYGNKYGFYGSLAEKAVKFIESKGSGYECKDLLRVVVDRSQKYFGC